MTLKITDEDRAAIFKARSRVKTRGWGVVQEHEEAIYLAGLRAGLERAAKVCEVMEPMFIDGAMMTLSAWPSPTDFASAIRALAKE